MASEDLKAYAVHYQSQANPTLLLLVKMVWMSAAAVSLASTRGSEGGVDAV